MNFVVPQVPCLVFLRKDLSLAWGLLVRLDWLVSKSIGPTHLYLYSTRIIAKASKHTNLIDQCRSFCFLRGKPLLAKICP